MIRTATWSGMGTDVHGIRTLDTVLKNAGLDYTVETRKIFFDKDKKIEIPGKVATVRKDNNQVYGIVSDSYQVCQNRDAFDFINYIKEDIKFVRAGETGSGLVFIIAELPIVKILGDEFKPHVIFQNGHNGGTSIKAAVCPLRIVCRNQFNMAFKEANNTVSIRHTLSMDGKLVEAREVLRKTAEYMEEMNKKAEEFAGIKYSSTEFNKIVDQLFPITSSMSERSIRRIEMKKSEFMSAYNNDDNSNFRGSAWGIINAYSDYITHTGPSRNTKNSDENNFMYVTFNPYYMRDLLKLLTASAV